MRLSFSLAACFSLTVLSFITLAPSFAHAQTYQVLYSFSGGNDGAHPQAGVAIDAGSSLYTTTTGGGIRGGNCYSFGCGAVVKFTRQGFRWNATPLYAFQGGSDGSLPGSGVIAGPNGALYGTTAAGGDSGSFGFGTVFSLQPASHACGGSPCPWDESVLYRFVGSSDGWQPTLGNLVLDSAGNMYGTTANGGSGYCYGGYGCGVVFKLTRSSVGWTQSVLHSFTGGYDGAYPQGGLVLDADGNLYGTTTSGGIGDCDSYVGGCGVIFQLSQSNGDWTETVVHSFTGLGDGGMPEGGLILGSNGFMYGTTESGGTGNGTVFELIPSQSVWTLNTIYAFPGPGVSGPMASLMMDAAGNLYGTTLAGPPRYPPCQGSVFKLAPGNRRWEYSLLHCFRESDGAQPYSPVTLGDNGRLYGTAYSGGTYGLGVVWEIAP